MITALLIAAFSIQAQCSTLSSIEKALTGAPYFETLTAVAVASPNIKVQFYLGEITRTWTILTVFPNGLACLSASGRDWRSVEPLSKGKDI